MGNSYWRIEHVTPLAPDDNRCVLLHGQQEEIVGPMTVELAEAWIAYFSQRREIAARTPPDLAQIHPIPAHEPGIGR